MSGLEEVEMIVHGGGVRVVLQHDDVGIAEDFIWVLSLKDMEGVSSRGDLCLRTSWGVDSGVGMTEMMRMRDTRTTSWKRRQW